MLGLSRILFTVLCFGSFILFVLIVYRRGAKREYDQIAQEIINDDDDPVANEIEKSKHGNGAK